MKKNIKRRTRLALLLAGLLLAAVSTNAQQQPEAEAQVDLVSQYLWRGLVKGGVSVQPQLKLSWQGAYVSVLGSKGFDNADAEELDLSLGYKFPFGLNVGVNDYWQSGVAENDLYFEYGKDNTAHRLEGNIGYSCKYGSLQAYCIFYGWDTTVEGKQAYSTYIELTVPFRLSGLDWTVKAGMTPMESAGSPHIVVPKSGVLYKIVGDYTYADGPACVLASLRATKTLSLGHGLSLPVYAEFSANPYLQTAHIMGGLAIKMAK
ncbi:MAG: hypothetical protein IJV36_01565 [Prevotella sp.]|nr:hypothetical protein [Prevotella sp.]